MIRVSSLSTESCNHSSPINDVQELIIEMTWRDVSSYLFTYLPLNYDTPVVPEYFYK